MIKKFIVIFILLTHNLFAQEETNTNIDNVINKIQNAPIDEKYIYMNELKRILKTKNAQFRQETLMKLQNDISQNKIDNHKDFDAPTSLSLPETMNNDLDFHTKPQEIEQKPPKSFDDNFKPKPKPEFEPIAPIRR